MTSRRRRARWPVGRRTRRPGSSSHRVLGRPSGAERLGRGLTVVAMLAGAVLLIAWQGTFRILEAWVTGAIAGAVRLAPTSQAGTSVYFPAKKLFIDFHIATGCTAALLISPFFVLAAGAVAVGRATLRQGIAALLVTALTIFTVNQIRLLVIVYFIRRWGYPHGYDVSHVMVGTVVSTLGVLGGLMVFVLCLRRTPRHRAAISG